jgi:hypothetical protein
MRNPGFTVTALLAGSLVGSLAATAHAGVYLESIEKDLAGQDKPSVSKMWFDGGRMRTERTEGDGDSQIVMFRNRTLYLLDPKTKSYRVMDEATARQLGSTVSNARKQMEARMKDMPPEQRAKLEELLSRMGQSPGVAASGAPKSTRTLTKTGRTETVAGIRCTVWEAVENGKKDQELCAAAPAAISGGDEIMKTFREISAMLSSLTDSFGGANDDGQPWHDMDKIDGVPILTRDFDDGKAESEMRLTTVKKESVAGTSFEVPAGYSEKKLGFGTPGG